MQGGVSNDGCVGAVQEWSAGSGIGWGGGKKADLAEQLGGRVGNIVIGMAVFRPAGVRFVRRGVGACIRVVDSRGRGVGFGGFRWCRERRVPRVRVRRWRGGRLRGRYRRGVRGHRR